MENKLKLKNATNIKYMDKVIEILPNLDRWVEVQAIDKTSFDFTMKLQKLFAPNDNYWHHKNLKEMKPGDVVLIYSKQTVKAIAIVTEESKIEENIYENLSEEVLAGSGYKTMGEYITVKIKTFELSIPIQIIALTFSLTKGIKSS